MAGIDTRNQQRSSVFIPALARFAGHGTEETDHAIKVRNLSSEGMMGEGTIRVAPGMKLVVSFGHLGSVEGLVVWVEGDRFGLAFDEEINLRLALAPNPDPANGTETLLDEAPARRPPAPPDPRSLRKI